MSENDKAQLSLLPGDKVTPESIVKLYEAITGRKATEEEIASIEREWSEEK